MRGPAATLAAIVAVGLVVGLLVPQVAGAPAPPEPPAAPSPEPTPPPEPTPTPTAAPAPDGDAPAEDPEDALLREQLGGLASLVLPAEPAIEACADPSAAPPPAGDDIDDVVAATESLRDLSLVDEVDVRLLDADEMIAEVAERFADRGEPERIDLEARTLTALGAIEPDTDLAELRVQAFAEHVSGLHAGQDGLVLLRVEDPRGLDALEQVVLAHEMEHALTFAHLGRPAEHRDDGEHADARRASLAVVEGSATLLMLQYARAVLDGEERAILRERLLERAREGALAGYTPYLLAELRFPYTEGLRFACTRWLDGGWDAVDATYTDPPETSADILFPERYGEEPAAPRALGGLEEPWERARTTTLGAAELLWLVEAPGGDPARALDDARTRVGGWDGGRLVVWTRGEDTAVGIALVERADGEERPPLCDTVRDWYAAAFPDATAATADAVLSFTGEAQDAALACPQGEVRLGIAPSADEAATLVR